MKWSGMRPTNVRGAALSLAGLLLTTALALSGIVSGMLAWICLALATVVVLIAMMPVSTRLEARSVVDQLDQQMRYVILTRHAIEANAEAHPPDVMGDFSVPNGNGRYGHMDLAEARQALWRLQAVGVIRQLSFDPAAQRTSYDWTPLGLAVLDRLSSEARAKRN